MNNESKTLAFTGRWIKFTLWGWILGMILIILLTGILESTGIKDMQFYVGMSMGAGVGLTQWLLLRKHMEMKSTWISASILGMGIPFLLFDLLITNTPYTLLLSVSLGGLLSGMLQYELIKRNFHHATLWIRGSFLGWTISALTVQLINYTMTMVTSGLTNLLLAFLNLGLILSGGLFLGLVTKITWKKMTFVR